MKIIDTHTGKLFVDTEHKLEFVSVGDYGQAENVKADFLGLKKEINGVPHHDVDMAEKWITLISTQHGCPMKCAFCDCPSFGYYGNVSEDELAFEVRTVLDTFPNVKHTKRFNLHFARMGEPSFNPAVLLFTEQQLRQLVSMYIDADVIHPVVSSMLPASNPWLTVFLKEWCRIKNDVYDGHAGLQLSIQSTDDEQRNKQFNNCSLPLLQIASICAGLPEPKRRKYTLNFAITRDTILDAKRLDWLFDKERFLVKMTPVHETKNAVQNGFDIGNTYEEYDVYKRLEDPLLELGWDVISAIPSKEEDSDRIICGNALIAETKNNEAAGND